MFLFCAVILFLVVWLVVPFAAKLNVVSVQFVDEWGKRSVSEGGRGAVRLHSRYARAMKAVGIECSGIGIVQKLTLIETYAAWLQHTVTVALGLK